jgi:hypothetical protein
MRVEGSLKPRGYLMVMLVRLQVTTNLEVT